MDEVPAPPARPPAPPPPPPTELATRLVFDGGFIGPMLPPASPAGVGPFGLGPSGVALPVIPPATEAVLAIPLGTRRLVAQALDLLTRPDAGLRSASFYIGFIVLLTVGPAAALFGLDLALSPNGPQALSGAYPDPYGTTTLNPREGWIVLAAFPALLGYLGASIEARALATAVIGGRVEGRPLRLRQSIAIARGRFWRILAIQFVVGVLVNIASYAVDLLVLAVLGPNPIEALSFGLSLLVALVVTAPFVYAPAGVILGEAGPMESIRRSVRLVRTRKQLAVVVTLFGTLSQLIVLLGLLVGLDVVVRLADGTGLAKSFPVALVIPAAAMLVFAFGTLTFLVEAIAAAPAVHAFAALTHYTHGLEVGRENPIRGRRLWDPWVTWGLAACAIVALLALVGGVVAGS